MGEEGGHSCGRILLIFTSFLSFLAVCAFNALSATIEQYDAGLFVTSTGNISDLYHLEITPAGWTFSIWGAIYAFQALFMIYALCTICIKTEESYLYISPAFICPSIYVFYIMNMGANVAWLFLFDRSAEGTDNDDKFLLAALGTLMFIVATLYICIGIAMWSLSKHADALIQEGKRSHVINHIAIVQNGLGIYAGWVTIATLLNLAIVLTYVVDVDMHLACTISLCILALDVFVFAIIDLVLFERHFRYMFANHIPLHMALIGSLAKNWDTNNTNTIITVALLAIGGVFLIVKIANCIHKSITDPLYSNNEKKHLSTLHDLGHINT